MLNLLLSLCDCIVTKLTADLFTFWQQRKVPKGVRLIWPWNHLNCHFLNIIHSFRLLLKGDLHDSYFKFRNSKEA